MNANLTIALALTLMVILCFTFEPSMRKEFVMLLKYITKAEDIEVKYNKRVVSFPICFEWFYDTDDKLILFEVSFARWSIIFDWSK